MTFKDLNLSENLLKSIATEGYETPTPIQAQAIGPILLKRDLLGCAQTGTGKTAAFALPILQNLASDAPIVGRRRIRTLVLTPTRELAIQIAESFSVYGRHTGIKNLVIFGGVNQNPQVRGLDEGVDILVATPGRLLDLMSQGFVNLSQLEIFVLDEADQMLDMGFIHDVKKIIAKIPKQRQTLFFSATMPPVIAELADTILTNPVKVAVAPVSSTADRIDQTLYFVEKNEKRHLLTHLLKELPVESALVFTRTKHGADRVVKDLLKADIQAEAIHGNKSQNARQRALGNFKTRKTWVLVATDIAARGLDIDQLSHVFNYELPNVPESYVHRIGRTGRAGESGIAISFCEREERPFLKDILKLIGRSIPVVADHPFKEGTGDVPDVVEPEAPRHGRGRQPITNPDITGRRPSRNDGNRAPVHTRVGQNPRAPQGNREPRAPRAPAPREAQIQAPQPSKYPLPASDRPSYPRESAANREPRAPRNFNERPVQRSAGTAQEREIARQAESALQAERAGESRGTGAPHAPGSIREVISPRDNNPGRPGQHSAPRDNQNSRYSSAPRETKDDAHEGVHGNHANHRPAAPRDENRGRTNKGLPTELLRGGQGAARPGLKRIDY